MMEDDKVDICIKGMDKFPRFHLWISKKAEGYSISIYDKNNKKTIEALTLWNDELDLE